MKKMFLLTIIITLLFTSNVYASENNEVQLPRTSSQQSLVLQKIALAEAGGEGAVGMAYVMQTILNRVGNEKFPNTIEDVINQKGQFSTSSYYDKYEPNEESLYALVLCGIIENKGQLYFERNSNDSWQSRNLNYSFTYLNHTFYTL